MGALFQAGLVECPAAVKHLLADTDHNIEGHPVFHPIVVGDDVLENLVDGLGFCFCEEPDPAEVDSQDRNLGVAGQFGGAQ